MKLVKGKKAKEGGRGRERWKSGHFPHDLHDDNDF